MSGVEETLQALLKRSTVETTTEDISLLADNLIPEAPKSARSLAFLNLSRLAQTKTSPAPNGKPFNAVRAYLDRVFSGEDDDVETYIPFVSLLSALFSLNATLALPLLTAEIPHAGDGESTPDVLDVLLEAAELPSSLQPALADLLGQAASTKQGREVIGKAEDWLRGAVEYDQKGDLGVLCAVALSKLFPGETSDAVKVEDTDSKMIEEVGLAKKMMDHITTAKSRSPAIVSTLEGLSILSTKGHIKHLLATSPSFLSALMDLSPVPGIRPSSLPVTPRASIDFDKDVTEPVETSLCYGLTTILVNITSTKPVLSAEDEQIAKLRAMAVSGKKGAAIEESPFDANEAVEERVKAVIKAGILSSLSGLVRADSVLVKEGLGRLCLNLVQDKSHRLFFVREGGFKVLSRVVRDLLDPPSKKDDDATRSSLDYLPAVQALAKLIITTPPHFFFPPPHDSTALNALSPLYMLLAHPSSSLLQTFEALMALTNLATISPNISDRMIEATVSAPIDDAMWRGSGREGIIKVITRVEELLLDSNTLVRRAATELVCNLITSPKGHAYLAGEPGSSLVSPRVRSRLNVIVVLTSVDDTATRLAASGALAMLTEDPVACKSLFSVQDETSNRSIWKRLMGLFEPDVPETDEEGEEIPVISTSPPHPDLVHRGVIILYNLVEYVAGSEESGRQIQLGLIRAAGLEGKMIEVIKENMSRREIIEPAVGIAKILKKFPG